MSVGVDPGVRPIAGDIGGDRLEDRADTPLALRKVDRISMKYTNKLRHT